MKGLMLHCGGRLASREEVVAVPLPAATSSYMPLPYESLLTRIEKQLAVEGIQIKEEKLALAKEGQRLFGLIEVVMPSFLTRDYGCVLGLRNSYDKSCAAGLCIGATVFVCDNLSFHGSQITFQRKHTANLLRDLSWIITEAMATLPALFAKQGATFEAYRNTALSDTQAHDLMIRLYDEGALNVGDIPPLLKEWREPRHREFAEGGKTAWRWFNAATEVMKGDLWRLPQKTRAVHELLDAECGIRPAETKAEAREEVAVAA